jgi:hypothetical protein
MVEDHDISFVGNVVGYYSSDRGGRFLLGFPHGLLLLDLLDNCVLFLNPDRRI